MRAFTQLAIATAAALGIALALRVAPAAANHTIYWGQRIGGAPVDLITNGVHYDWYYSYEMRFWIDPAGGSSLRTAVLVAISAWQSSEAGVLSGLKWVEDIDGVDPAPMVTFVWDTDYSAHCPGGVACVTWSYQWSDAVRANYMHWTQVWFDANYPFTPITLGALAAHEIGHIYGLDERYLHNPSRENPNENVVMDSFDLRLTPAALDTDRSKTFWRGMNEASGFQPKSARLDGWGIVKASRFIVRAEWDDLAWADYVHEIVLHRWNGSGWDVLERTWPYDNIGMNKFTASLEGRSRRLGRDWDITAYGGGDYTACGRPWYSAGMPLGQIESYTWTCSAFLIVPS